MNIYKDKKPGKKKEWRLLADIPFQKTEPQEQTQLDQITQVASTLGHADGVLDTLASMIQGVFKRLEKEKGKGNFQLRIQLWVQSEEGQTADSTDQQSRPWGFFSVLKSLPGESGPVEPMNYVLDIYIYFE